MNFKQWLGLEPERTCYETHNDTSAVAGISHDGELFAAWCNDPGKVTFMIELRKSPAMPSRLIYLHPSGIQMLDVIQSYEFKDGLLTLEYRARLAHLVRARGCQVFINKPGVDVPEIERVLKLLFADVKPDFPGLPPHQPDQNA